VTPVKVDWTNVEQQKLKILIYGLPGAGKTWFAASAVEAQETSPALILTAAGNPQSLMRWKNRPDTFVINDLEDLNPFYAFFAEGQPKGAGMIERLGLNPPYRCLVVDGMTELQRYTLSQVGGYSVLGPGTRGKALQIQQFNPVLEHTIRMASLFFGLADPGAKLPIHVIITSLEWHKLNIKTQQTTVLPLIWGSANTEVAGYALASGRIRHASSVPKKVMKTIPDAPADTPVIFWRPQPGVPLNKDQYGGVLGDYMANPTIQKVVDLVYGGEQTHTKASRQTQVLDEEAEAESESEET
jgi:hypothetical protein